MKKTIRKGEITAFLSLALFSLALNFSTLALAQTPRRERVIEKPTPTPKSTPRVSPSVKPTATPTVAPTVTPTPAVTPSATPTPAPVQTLPELQSKIRTILLRPAIMRGQVGLKVISLDSNKVLFEDNAEKYFMPASNMKSFTIATAMEKLTPNFRFVTSVYANSQPDASGTIRGNLTIYGRGDPSFSMAFTRPDTTTPVTESDYLKGLDALAEKIVQSGVKRVEGNLIGDESYFNTDAIPSTWEWDDLQWYYGAEVSALTILDNALDLNVKPSSVGAPAIVQLMPGNSLMTVINRTVTAPAGTKRELEVNKHLAQNVLEVSGKIPADDKGYSSSVAISRPALLFTTLLRKLLEQKGVVVTGQTRVVDAKEKALTPVIIALQPVEIAKLESPPFALIAAKTMKPSQNLYTELILRALGEQVGDKSDPKKSSERRGIEVVSSFLGQAGITPGSVVQYDGCGLSRHDLITPAASAQLYTYMNARPYAASWRESLTIAGVDGTLKNRFVGTPAAGNVRGKTGTVDQVSALSGYVTTAAGERLAFSVLTNGIPESRLRTSTIDEIVLLLTNFNGKTN